MKFVFKVEFSPSSDKTHYVWTDIHIKDPWWHGLDNGWGRR